MITAWARTKEACCLIIKENDLSTTNNLEMVVLEMVVLDNAVLVNNGRGNTG